MKKRNKIDGIDDKFLLMKGELYDKLAEYDVERLKKEEKLKDTLKNLESLDVEHQTRLDNNKTIINKLQASIKKMSISNKSIRDQMKSLSIEKIDHKDFNSIKIGLREDIEILKMSLQDTKVDLRETESFISVFKPVKEFDQIVKALDHIICDKKERKRLSQYVA